LRFACLYAAAWLAWLLLLPPRPSAWVVGASGVPLLVLGSRAAWRGHAGSWRAWLLDAWDVHALGAMLLAALAVQFADSHGVTTDGVIYFSQLRSALFDGDLDVTAEFAALGQPSRPSHVVPIGPTFVWLPLYLCVMAVDRIARVFGAADPVGLAGLTLPYVRAALVSSFGIGAVGLFALHARLRHEFAPGVAFAASTLVFLATPLVWYMVYEPAMTHAASFGFVALFVVAAARFTQVDMSPVHGVTLGALLGVAVMTRPQEAIFALFPAILLLTSPAPFARRVRGALRLALWALVGVTPFLGLQAIHSAFLLGREQFVLGGGGEGYLDFFNSRWADTLWSSWHGFFAWTPVAYLAFLAMFAYLRRNRGWALAAIVIVLLMAWVNGATADWAAGWSFGGRRFISVLAVLCPGIALIVHGLTRRPVVALAIVAAAAIAWNQLLQVQHTRGMLTSETPVSFAQIIRQQAALATAPPFVYPFAFPANALFAWRTGLPLSSYDLLGFEPLRSDIDLPLTANASRFFTAGWGNRVSDPFGELYWIDGQAAELLLPLDLPPNRNVTVSWSTRTRRLEPPEPATFALVINGRETFRFTPDTDQQSSFSFTVPAGESLWVRGFNRVAFERRAGSAPIGVYGIAVKAVQ
jgi:hypothetical protein